MRSAVVVYLAIGLSCALLASAQAPDGTLSFIAFGDWGGQSSSPYTTDGERSLAAWLPNTIQANGTQFILAIGDNFYDEGVKNVNDKRFQETFEKVFTSPETQLPWYVVAGNHDHNGNASAEVAYSAHSKRWIFPSLYYTFNKTVQSSSGDSFTVQFVMIDTVKLDDGDATQLAWIEDQLKQSVDNQVDWVLVAGHYPVWSVAEHGTTKSLQKDLKPLLDKYQVGAYFCGHDHDLQHIQTDESVGYYVTGAGHTAEYNQDHINTVPDGSLMFYWPPDDSPPVQSGFITVLVTADQLQVDYLDSLGDVLYSTQQANPRSSSKRKVQPKRSGANSPLHQLKSDIVQARIAIA